MTTRGNILVADDDAAIRTVLNQALSRVGHEVLDPSGEPGVAHFLLRAIDAAERDARRPLCRGERHSRPDVGLRFHPEVDAHLLLHLGVHVAAPE